MSTLQSDSRSDLQTQQITAPVVVAPAEPEHRPGQRVVHYTSSGSESSPAAAPKCLPPTPAAAVFAQAERKRAPETFYSRVPEKKKRLDPPPHAATPAGAAPIVNTYLSRQEKELWAERFRQRETEAKVLSARVVEKEHALDAAETRFQHLARDQAEQHARLRTANNRVRALESRPDNIEAAYQAGVNSGFQEAFSRGYRQGIFDSQEAEAAKEQARLAQAQERKIRAIEARKARKLEKKT